MIYFIQCGENGPIKIGQSDDVEARMSQLQIACPYKLKLLWVYTGNMYTEKDIHREFSHERIRGEWFHPSRRLFKSIEKNLCNIFEFCAQNLGYMYSLIERYPGALSLATQDFVVAHYPEEGRVAMFDMGDLSYKIFDGLEECDDNAK